jgi:nitric oxide reductase NorQ protein
VLDRLVGADDAAEGLPLRRAVQSAIIDVLTDDPDLAVALGELVDAFVPST